MQTTMYPQKLLSTIVLLAVVLVVLGPYSFASSWHPSKTKDVNEPVALAKMDLRLSEAVKTGDGSEGVELLIKTRPPVTDDQKVLLKTAGFTARTWVGSIATGSARIKNIINVASLDFVEVMELATPLTPKNHVNKTTEKN